MSITLVTGVPGAGKTAWTVDQLIDNEGKRKLITDGVPELILDADAAPPIKEWIERVPDESSQSGEKLQFSFAPGSLVVIDECQRVFPRRGVGAKVPDVVAAFETHRHRGLDFILITQHPRLLDSHVRSLVGRHIHFRQTWQGRHKYEWAEVADPESSAARAVAARDRYVLPKRVFDRYKSAEVHTKTRFKLPMYAYMLVGALILMAVMGYRTYSMMQRNLHPEIPTASSSGPSVAGMSGKQTNSGAVEHVKSSLEYNEQFVPRVPGLHHTAPAYDQVTQVQDAPIPVGCVLRFKSDCRCIDQQGNTYATTPQVCTSFVKDGMFIPWRNVAKERADQERYKAEELRERTRSVAPVTVAQVAPKNQQAEPAL